MITVNGWRAGGMGGGLVNGEMSVHSMGEIGKYFCPNFLQLFLENSDRRSCNDGSRELIPVFHNCHRKFRQVLHHRKYAFTRGVGSWAD